MPTQFDSREATLYLAPRLQAGDAETGEMLNYVAMIRDPQEARLFLKRYGKGLSDAARSALASFNPPEIGGANIGAPSTKDHVWVIALAGTNVRNLKPVQAFEGGFDGMGQHVVLTHRVNLNEPSRTKIPCRDAIVLSTDSDSVPLAINHIGAMQLVQQMAALPYPAPSTLPTFQFTETGASTLGGMASPARPVQTPQKVAGSRRDHAA